MLRIAICDDEKAVSAQIEKVILDYANLIGQPIETTVFFTGESLCRYLSRGEAIDLVFLDIELGGINGVDVGETIRNTLNNNTIQIVYISAKEQYAMKLFKVRPFDFLIKPIDEEEIQNIIQKVFKLMGQLKQYFTYRKNGKLHKMAIKDILYFESNNRMINIVTHNKTDTFYGKLGDIANQLAHLKFLYIHKSYLVNYFYMLESQYEKVTMVNQRTLPISQARRKRIRELQLIFEREETKECI